MSELQSLTLRAADLNQSVDWWNTAMIWALVAAAIVAIAVVVTTRIALVRTKQLSDIQDRISGIKEAAAKAEQDRLGTDLAAAVARGKEADARIAEAQRGSAEANVRATKAQESLALAEQHSAEANAKAEGFRLDIAKANESAEQARAQVAGAMAESAKANLELARLKTPRTLTKEQQDRITLKIAVFPNTPYDLSVSTDSDSTNLMHLVDSALTVAKWEFHQAGIITFANKAMVVATSGVSITFPEELRSTLEAPSLALANALIAEGIPIVGVFRDQAGVDRDRTRVHVIIGSKPLN